MKAALSKQTADAVRRAQLQQQQLARAAAAAATAQGSAAGADAAGDKSAKGQHGDPGSCCSHMDPTLCNSVMRTQPWNNQAQGTQQAHNATSPQTSSISLPRCCLCQEAQQARRGKLRKRMQPSMQLWLQAMRSSCLRPGWPAKDPGLLEAVWGVARQASKHRASLWMQRSAVAGPVLSSTCFGERTSPAATSH